MQFLSNKLAFMASISPGARFIGSCITETCNKFFQDMNIGIFLQWPFLKGYCTVFQLALKSLEISVSVLSERMSKTARKNTKGLNSYKEFKF